jgi:WYL domain
MPSPTVPLSLTPDRISRWGQERRLEFIDFRLYWERRLNRADLTEFFGISVQQASLDIARYIELAPKNVEYDKSEKVYVATGTFEPILTDVGSSQYLNQLLAVSMGMMSPGMSFLGWYPGFAAVLSPTRTIEPGTLQRILKAVRHSEAVWIEYQSMSRPQPTVREISPHALAYDGFRWHTRAYCHERLDFRDFVCARILRIGDFRASDISPEQDVHWNALLEVILGPHPELPPQQRRAIELDYGMVEGQINIQCRKALLFYFLRRLGLERQQTSAPPTQQIILLNRDELAPHLEAVSS